jgi:hypothetical protein
MKSSGRTALTEQEVMLEKDNFMWQKQTLQYWLKHKSLPFTADIF